MTTEEQAEKMARECAANMEKIVAKGTGKNYDWPEFLHIILSSIPLVELLEVARSANSLPMSGISDEDLALLDALAALEAKGIEL